MNLFPRTLARIPYLIRIIILWVVAGILIVPIALVTAPHDENGSGALGLIGGLLILAVVVVAVAYNVGGLATARIRSCGWNPWLALILLIPGVGGIFNLVLLFIPPVDPNAP